MVGECGCRVRKYLNKRRAMLAEEMSSITAAGWYLCVLALIAELGWFAWAVLTSPRYGLKHVPRPAEEEPVVTRRSRLKYRSLLCLQGNEVLASLTGTFIWFALIDFGLIMLLAAVWIFGDDVLKARDARRRKGK